MCFVTISDVSNFCKPFGNEFDVTLCLSRKNSGEDAAFKGQGKHARDPLTRSVGEIPYVTVINH